MFFSADNHTAALQQFDRVLSVYERTLPAEHPLRIGAMSHKASALRELGRLGESLDVFTVAIKLARHVFEEDSDLLVKLEKDIAKLLVALGNREMAAEVYERLIRVFERSPRFGSTHMRTWESRSSLGDTLVILGKFSAAIPLFRDSLAAYDSMGLAERRYPVVGFAFLSLGRALLGAGRAAEAVPMFQRSITFFEHHFGPHHHIISTGLIPLAEAYKHLGRGFGERLPLLDRAVAIFEHSILREETGAGLLAETLTFSAACYEEAGRLGEAEAQWVKCVATYTKARSSDFALASSEQAQLVFCGSGRRPSESERPA